MACSSVTLAGINLGCKDNMGGIKEVYLIKAEDVTNVALDPESHEVNTITLSEPAKFKTYKFRKGTSNMVSTASTDEAAGNFSVQTDVNLQFSKMETSKRLEIMGMCLENLKAVVLDSNNIYWFLGMDFPLSASAATGNTGTAYTDFSGYNVTISDFSREFPYALSSSAVEALKAQIDPAPVI